MNEPTPEQIEAAAKAMHAITQGDPFEDYHPSWQESRRAEARAALVAAAGAGSEPVYEYGIKRPYVDGWERGDKFDENHNVERVNAGQVAMGFPVNVRRRAAGPWEEIDGKQS